MPMRNPYDPCGGRAPLVDRFIGNAYAAVRHVADHIPQIRYLVANMAHIVRVSQGIRRSGLILGTTGSSLGSSVEIPLPDGVVAEDIVASDVVIQSRDGNIYSSGSGVFSYYIRQGKLRVTLSSSAPGNITNSEIRWSLVYGG